MSGSPITHSYSLGEKIDAAFLSARQRLAPSRCLIAGPYAGEFGWELMQWQGYVRARRPAYQQVHVITYPGRDYLYEQCQVHYHSIPLSTAGHRYGNLAPRESRKIADAKARELGLQDYDVFSPDLLCTRYHKRLFWRQEFRLFEEPALGAIRHVGFHFRQVQKQADHPKNYPPALAQQLVDRCLEQGLSILCIGHPDFSFCPPNCQDLRSVDLRSTVAAICSVRAVVGENSGPMHLANLCGKPTILWAYHQNSIDYSLRWNPFRVPIYIAANDTHEPPPKRVCHAILHALEDLARRTEHFTRPAHCLPAQRIAPY